MTAAQTRNCKPYAAQNAVVAHRNECVLRAGRVEAAGRGEQRREDELVEPDQRDEQKPHGRLGPRERRDELGFKVEKRNLGRLRKGNDEQAHRAVRRERFV